MQLRITLALLVALGWTSTLQAQSVPIIPGGGPNGITGGPGNSTVVGTGGGDTIWDPSTGDTDLIQDSPAPPDGVADALIGTDGDNNDTLEGGPEDTYLGDPWDKVIIRGGVNKAIWWQGTYLEYKRMRRLVQWWQDRIKMLALEAGTLLEDFWTDAFTKAQSDLEAITPTEDPFDLRDYFPIGPYHYGEVPPSPLGFLNWFQPSMNDLCEREVCDPMLVKSWEYQDAVSSALQLLQRAMDAASDAGDDAAK